MNLSDQNTGSLASNGYLKPASEALSRLLDKSQALTPKQIQPIMDECFGVEAWDWRDAYDACEAATWLFLIRWAPAIKQKAGTNAGMLALLGKIEAMLPSQTWRSPEQNNLQQFSTPLPFAWLAAHAADLNDSSIVLEPSAGTGALAIHAHVAGARLQLNEIAPRRVDVLEWLFPDTAISRHHGAYIHAQQRELTQPDTILMNPPFGADINKGDKRSSEETVRHFQSAFYRLIDGGRAIIITGGTMTADRLTKGLDVAAPRLSVMINGRAYQKQGLNVKTALHIIDKVPSEGAPVCVEADTLADALVAIENDLPERSVVVRASEASDPSASKLGGGLFEAIEPVAPPLEPVLASAQPLAYEANPVPVLSIAGTGIFQPWQMGAVRIPGSVKHPTALAEGEAMASIRPPLPTYQPLIPRNLIEDGILSDAQLETIIYAGNAHSVVLPQRFDFEEGKGAEVVMKVDGYSGFPFRQGYFLGDGTGAGKGRQVAGIMLDNFNQGRRKALWLSKSDKLVEDAKRDWVAVGGSPADIISLSKYKQGQPINLPSGILFATYATLRSAGKNGKQARIDQVIGWLGDDFDGCIIFDEAHALSNAAGGEKTARGIKPPSQQGITGLVIQNRLPDARVVYVSATGASSVNALAYATRLGLWSQPGFPFSDRERFVQAMNAGGVAAAEIVARDLKALGLYTSRSLSYEGVEIDILNTPLVDAQRNIYDSWATAFQIIHKNLERALVSTGAVSADGVTLNKNLKAAAKSAFESTKQRFFGHLLTSMKCPQLFKAIDQDIEEGRAVIIQLVSTGEAIMERCLQDIDPSEWSDLSVDVTPRDSVLDYVKNAFPVHMQIEYTDDEGKLRSEPLFDQDGNPVLDPEALEARDRMIESLIALSPLPSALDQLIWHYGKDKVAEITGRGRRIVRHPDGRMAVENRSSSAGLTEAQAFMADEKQILVFSEAGGTGRSYHADAAVKNQRRRVHYLLEAGWRADNAIQGLGRSNRTGQVSPPIFRPVSTDVKGEKRFIATIARRLDTLGAITRGQRASANQGLFKEEDNLESPYAKSALSQFYRDLHHGNIEAISLIGFEEITGLSLTYEGRLLENLPLMHTFLNRLLALPIGTQNALFAELEGRIASRIEVAQQNGTYELGVETIRADRIVLDSTEEVQGGLRICSLKMSHRIRPTTIEDLQTAASVAFNPKWCKNARSEQCALIVNTVSLFNEDGSITPRVELIRPDRRERIGEGEFKSSYWEEVSMDEFAKCWQAEIEGLAEFRISHLNLVTGILLPVWDKLPRETPRVRRLTTDEGEVLLGRVLDDEQLEDFRSELGLESVQPEPDELFDRLIGGGHAVALAGGFRLVFKRVYGDPKIELLGDTHDRQEELTQIGCRIEFQSYRMRVFIPNIACIKNLLARWPVA